MENVSAIIPIESIKMCPIKMYTRFEILIYILVDGRSGSAHKLLPFFKII